MTTVFMAQNERDQMLKSILNNYHLSKAAVVVDNVTGLHGIRALGVDPAALANMLVGDVFNEIPDMISGKTGKRPHKLSLAAAALTKGISGFAANRDKQLVLHLALGTVLLELTGNPNPYALTGVDHFLIDKAQQAYLDSAS